MYGNVEFVEIGHFVIGRFGTEGAFSQNDMRGCRLDLLSEALALTKVQNVILCDVQTRVVFADKYRLIPSTLLLL